MVSGTEITSANVEKALSMVEAVVAEMAVAGFSPVLIATALAWHVNDQVRRTMPTEATATLFKLALIDAPEPLHDVAMATLCDGA
ncbi:MAG: hypothetical protein QM699_07555 [Amaricoccus sp.]|uniref:hypothetical protein n=1 Tax=Amaricoccus sp. TaxID=1872485 RepID=UPI0039E5D755